jgi:uncharacterized membrane protein YoaK (UPF0700 family)
MLGFPTGILLAKLCKDEIKKWKGRMILISALSGIIIICLIFLPIEIYPYKYPAIITLIFIVIMCLTIYWKSR